MDYQKEVQDLLEQASRYVINPNPVTELEIKNATIDKTYKCFAVFNAIKTKLKGLYGEAFVIPNDIFGEESRDIVAFSAQWFLKTGEHGKFSVLWEKQVLKLKFTRNLLRGCMKVATKFAPRLENPEGKPEDYVDVKLNNGVFYFNRLRLGNPFMSVTFDPSKNFIGCVDTFETRAMAYIDTFLMA